MQYHHKVSLNISFHRFMLDVYCTYHYLYVLKSLLITHSLRWKPFLKEGFLKIWPALFVEMMLNLLIMLFLDVISHPWFGTFGLKILFTLKDLKIPSLTRLYLSSLTQLFKIWSSSLPRLGPYGLTEIVLYIRMVVFLLSKFGIEQEMLWKNLHPLLVRILA